jgi:hypothetical protein
VFVTGARPVTRHIPHSAGSDRRDDLMRARAAVLIIALLLAGALLYVIGIASSWYGELESAGDIEAGPIPAAVREAQDSAQGSLGAEPTGQQILFGDLHVHTTFSSDAFRMSLPMIQGDGAHPPADACDFARMCSALDFWALTDHAESLTRERWNESIESVRQCNAVAGDPANPDMVTYMGFEWTQAGATPATHFGHKNVIFRDIESGQLPARPIGSPYRAVFGSIPLNLRLLPPLRDLPERQRYYDFGELIQTIGRQQPCPEEAHVRDLPAGCVETAATPAVLFRKLAEWGLESIVIPHGNTWGVYSPPGTSWDKQLVNGMHDPQRQILMEVFSGHGAAEVYRDWRAVDQAPTGEPLCPEPGNNYLPSCWQAGEIIRRRCQEAGNLPEECAQRAAEARDRYLAFGPVGWHTVPGARLEDWLDSGQCRDCFLPAFNYRPRGSAQYALAISRFDEMGEPQRFRFGFIASSDNHSARPGTGYKQYARNPMVDWWGYGDAGSRELFTSDRGEPIANSVNVDIASIDIFNRLEMERQASFFVTGGLVAAHATGRNRDAIWDALARREVYGTSGQRILLWFDLLAADDADSAVSHPMGSAVTLSAAPRFRAKAIGSFVQAPGCPDYSINGLSPERLQALCRGECYNPSNQRVPISRIEVIRIRPQARAGEAVGPLIEDPWRSFECDLANATGCTIEFTDEEFTAAGRDAVYYVRALEAPRELINAGGLRCKRDAEGNCLEVNACYGDDRTGVDDLCLETEQPRAWSSPIFVDYEPTTADATGTPNG